MSEMSPEDAHAIQAAVKKVGDRRVVHDGILELQAAIDEGRAEKVGSNVVGVEVSLDNQSLGNVRSSLIVGEETEVRVGPTEGFSGNYIKNSKIIQNETGAYVDSSFVDSEVVAGTFHNSQINGSKLEGIFVYGSEIEHSEVTRNRHSQEPSERRGIFGVKDSRVKGYRENKRIPNTPDPDIMMVDGQIEGAGDIVSITTDGGDVTVHRGKNGSAVYTKIEGNPESQRALSKDELLKALPRPRFGKKKALEEELDGAATEVISR